MKMVLKLYLRSFSKYLARPVKATRVVEAFKVSKVSKVIISFSRPMGKVI